MKNLILIVALLLSTTVMGFEKSTSKIACTTDKAVFKSSLSVISSEMKPENRKTLGKAIIAIWFNLVIKGYKAPELLKHFCGMTANDVKKDYKKITGKELK